MVINGGVKDLDHCKTHWGYVDGVMLGRSAYQNPYMLAQIEQYLLAQSRFLQDTPSKTREQILLDFIPYVEQQLAEGVALKNDDSSYTWVVSGRAGRALISSSY